MTCPLCLSKYCSEFYKDKFREYLQCNNCEFVFVPKSYHLSETDEKLRYDTHNNNPLDNRYRNFLSQLEEPLLHQIPEKSYGLDFGSGPGPTLSLMLEEKGHHVELYDKFYASNDYVFNKRFAFVSATEVVADVRAPMRGCMR